jgi:hypothetical protein
MAPLYESLCQQFSWTQDRTLLDKMKYVAFRTHARSSLSSIDPAGSSTKRSLNPLPRSMLMRLKI